MTFQEIAEEIRQGKNLDVHIKSESKFVRRLVAEQNYKLDVLINDPAEEVRAVVAKQGYSLPLLRNDRSDWVRLAALDKLEERRTQNAGYRITKRIELDGSQFVLGHNPNKPDPYVTWQYHAGRDYYHAGHYFTDPNAAIVDLFKRAGETLDFGNKSLALSLLSEEDHAAIRADYREESEKEAVYYALEDLLDDNHPYDYNALIADPDFMARAIHLYYRIDHSYENEAFADNLENLLEEFPQYKQEVKRLPDFLDNPEPIRIPPEEANLLNDLLTHPSAEIPSLYGPFGDNFDFTFTLSEGYTATVEMMPYNDPQRNQLSETEPPYVQVRIVDQSGRIGHSEVFFATDLNHTLTGEIPLTNDAGKNFLTLKIQQDENLRRIGNQFIFRFHDQDENYMKHNGEICTVQRPLTSKECDILITGLMWEAEFPDGERLHIFDYELEPLQERQRKPSLQDLLESAQNKQAESSHDLAKDLEPER